MRFTSKLATTIGTLVVCVIMMAGLLTWGGQRLEYQLEKSRLAYAEFETYLTLSSETFRLFKLLRRDFIDNGKREIDLDLEMARADLERRLDVLRKQIEEDQRFGSGESRQERDSRQLRRVAALTRELRETMTDVSTALQMLAGGEQSAGERFLSQTLQSRIDDTVSKLLDEGVYYERATAYAAHAEASNMVLFLKQAAWGVAGAALVFGVVLGVTLFGRFTTPMGQLVEATHQYSSGALDHRIPVKGRDEFAMLAKLFNAMARQIAFNQDEVRTLNIELERKVDERTKQLASANAALNVKDTVRRRLFADISHELRTPITIIRGEAEVGLRARTDVEVTRERALERIAEYSEHLTQLVSDIFVIAKSHAGILEFRDDDIDLVAVVRAMGEDLAHLSSRASQTLHVTVLADDAWVVGDRTRLMQLVAIAIDNAARHAGHGAKVELILARESDGVSLTVRDDGVGIAEKELPFIFDSYRRSRRVEASGMFGSGIGLPLAQAIVGAMHGQIGIQSKLGHGTTVRITLPLAGDRNDQIQGAGEVA